MQLVVGVALMAAGRVLAARRATPAALAGSWEFPGGKVEADESPADTAVREIGEELACGVEVTGWLDGSARIDDELVLRVALARLTVGDPVPSEHDAVRWLASDQLHEVDWVAADVQFLSEMGERLEAHAGGRG